MEWTELVRVIDAMENCTGPGNCHGCAWAKCYCNDFAPLPRGLVEEALTFLRVMVPEDKAKWVYYVNDEGRARWRCSRCGKICRRDPNDKKWCSGCGARMEKEA